MYEKNNNLNVKRYRVCVMTEERKKDGKKFKTSHLGIRGRGINFASDMHHAKGVRHQ